MQEGPLGEQDYFQIARRREKKKISYWGSKEQNLHINRRLKCPSSIPKQLLSLVGFVPHTNIFHNKEELVPLLFQ